MINEGNPNTRKKLKKLMVNIGRGYRKMDKETPIRSVTAKGRELLRVNQPLALKLATEGLVKKINKQKKNDVIAAIADKIKDVMLGNISGRTLTKTMPSASIRILIKQKKPSKEPLSTDNSPLLSLKKIRDISRSPYTKRLLRASFHNAREEVLDEYYAGMFRNQNRIHRNAKFKTWRKPAEVRQRKLYRVNYRKNYNRNKGLKI